MRCLKNKNSIKPMADTVPIPHWTAEGLIPPVDAADPVSSNRSPYRVSLADLVLRFAMTPDRTAILDGFLRYRSALHAAEITEGFQWIDGSFTEDIETTGRRSPNDLDLVTFFRIPPRVPDQSALVTRDPSLFPVGPAAATVKADLKTRFRVDAYLVPLPSQSADLNRVDRLVERSCYWYGMWSHQRDTQRWKGYLEIDLDPAEDLAARALLTPSTPTAVTP
jgi:hypothetical protein